MISHIIGEVEYICDSFIILENNGIGYKIFVSKKTLNSINNISKIKVYIYMNIKEDSITLFGFHNILEKDIFNLLLEVSGVGPKVAICIINELTLDQINSAILTDDFTTFVRCNGVGKKTAQRIILELKDKIKNIYNYNIDINNMDIKSNKISNIKNDAVEALLTLGYSKNEISKVLSQIDIESNSIDQIIKDCLKKLTKVHLK